MASLINSPRLQGFEGSLRRHKRGLDLGMKEGDWSTLGHLKAADGTVWRAGQILALDANGLLVVSDGNAFIGVAMYGKNSGSVIAMAADQAVVFPSSGAVVTMTGFTTITDLVLRSAVQQGGTLYTVTTDYTVQSANGTITHVGAGALVVGTTYYASFSYVPSTSQLDREGRNFWNAEDDVSQWGNFCPVLSSSNLVVSTTEFVKISTVPYTLTGVGSNLYCNSTGQLTNQTGQGALVGHVLQLPSSDYPYLRCKLNFTARVRT